MGTSNKRATGDNSPFPPAWAPFFPATRASPQQLPAHPAKPLPCLGNAIMSPRLPAPGKPGPFPPADSAHLQVKQQNQAPGGGGKHRMFWCSLSSRPSTPLPHWLDTSREQVGIPYIQALDRAFPGTPCLATGRHFATKPLSNQPLVLSGAAGLERRGGNQKPSSSKVHPQTSLQTGLSDGHRGERAAAEKHPG